MPASCVRPHARAGSAAAACLLVAFVLPPQHTVLDTAAAADAVRIGRSSPSDLDAFHRAYRIAVDDPVIRQIDVVTPFRRLVQMTEERVRLRDATWDAARAAVAAQAFEGRVDLAIELEFSPANTYRTVPAYTVAVYRRGAPATALLPIDIRSAARYLSGQPAPPGTPILSATVTSTFDAAQIDSGSPVLVGIFLDDKEVRRVVVDLAALR